MHYIAMHYITWHYIHWSFNVYMIYINYIILVNTSLQFRACEHAPEISSKKLIIPWPIGSHRVTGTFTGLIFRSPALFWSLGIIPWPWRHATVSSQSCVPWTKGCGHVAHKWGYPGYPKIRTKNNHETSDLGSSPLLIHFGICPCFSLIFDSLPAEPALSLSPRAVTIYSKANCSSNKHLQTVSLQN